MRNQIIDMFSRINNAQLKKHEKICLFTSPNKICIKILNILEKEGFICGFEINKNHIFVYLKYNAQGIPAIKKITNLTKPGRVLSVKIKTLWNLQNGLGIYIISTTQGLMTDFEARKKNLGGILLFNIY